MAHVASGELVFLTENSIGQGNQVCSGFGALNVAKLDKDGMDTNSLVKVDPAQNLDTDNVHQTQTWKYCKTFFHLCKFFRLNTYDYKQF